MSLKLTVSPVQHGMYFHYMHNKNKDYQEQMICEIFGDLDIEIFERTLNKLIELFDSLRTVFIYDEKEGVQLIIQDRKIVNLDYTDISKISNPKRYIEQRILFESDKNFNLSKETCRNQLYKIGEKNFVFLCTYHHLIMDSWSILLFQETFCKFYLNEANGILDNTSNREYSYKLYIDWINNQDHTKSVKYWETYLDDYAQLNRPYQFKVNQVLKRKKINIKFEKQIRNEIFSLADEFKTTVNSLFLAIWGIFILDKFQKSDILFGCVTSGRLIGLKNVDKIAGLFVNSIPVHVKRNSSLFNLTIKLQKDILLASKYSYLSLSEIMGSKRLTPGDVCSFLNFSIDAEEIKNKYSAILPFQVKNIRYNEQSNFDLYLDIYLNETSFDIQISYDLEKYFFDELQVKEKITQIFEFFKSNREILVSDVINRMVNNEELTKDASFNF
jgi:iturin family lipopeptide synthetase C